MFWAIPIVPQSVNPKTKAPVLLRTLIIIILRIYAEIALKSISLDYSRVDAALFDKCSKLAKIEIGRFLMKDFFKTLLAIIGLMTAFMVGFSLGKEKERRKIPEFQED
jgi:hypothetical protein